MGVQKSAQKLVEAEYIYLIHVCIYIYIYIFLKEVYSQILSHRSHVLRKKNYWLYVNYIGKNFLNFPSDFED